MQTTLVLLIVLAAAAYSAWRLAPASLRQRLAAHSGALARAGGASDALARRIEIKALDAANAGSCGNCGPCKACASSPAKDEPPLA